MPRKSIMKCMMNRIQIQEMCQTLQRESFVIADRYQHGWQMHSSYGWRKQMKLYAVDQTFWFPQQPTSFLFRQSHLMLYKPRLFYRNRSYCAPMEFPAPTLHRLYRHFPISRPRCIDFGSTFWMIGFRYRGLNCLHPSSQKKTVTFRSWVVGFSLQYHKTLPKNFPHD
jgi:hypothetical protein